MLKPSCWPKWCSNSKLNTELVILGKYITATNHHPKTSPNNVYFFCMMCFSVSETETLCDGTCSSKSKTEHNKHNKSNCCQFRHNLLVILHICMIEGAMATAGSAAFPTLLVSDFCKHKQACCWIRVKRIASFASLLMKRVKVLHVWHLFLCWRGCWKKSQLKTKDLRKSQWKAKTGALVLIISHKLGALIQIIISNSQMKCE